MTNYNELYSVIEKVLQEMNITDLQDGGKKQDSTAPAKGDINVVTQCSRPHIEHDLAGSIDDITGVDIREQYLVPHPRNAEVFSDMKSATPARIGIYRTGARYLTQTMLRFRADHSAAQDSVFSYVSEDFLKKMDLFTVNSLCKDKDEYITRPDLGRKIDDDGIKLIKEKCKQNPKVQIVIADGLSSAAIEANISDVLPSIISGLKSNNIDYGTPFFIRLGRVGAMDVVTEVVGAEVTCLLVGERPGLVTAESMSAYITYKGEVDMPEARRTVVSNIHRGGSVPVEAGAHIADIIKIMLDKKVSGTDLML